MEETNLSNQPRIDFDSQKPAKKRNVVKLVIWVLVIVILIVTTAVMAYRFGGYKERLSYNGTDSTYIADSVFVDGWANPQDYEQWKGAVFSIPQYSDIPVAFQRGIVKIFLDNNYFDKSNTDNAYFFTKIKDRAYRVIAYGDFTGQGEREMAFLLEKTDYASSAIFIIPQKGNVLYWKALDNELPTIKNFRKGALIFMGDMKLVPAPNDGIIKQTKTNKYVLIYNHQTKTFDEYYQYTDEDIKNAQEEANSDDDEEETEADTVKVAEQ